MSRHRRPTEEEIGLWEQVTHTVAPLPKARRPGAKETPTAEASPPGAKPKAKPSAAASTIAGPRPAPAKKPAALAVMDKRARSRVSRGVTAIDRRIDLHGMTQAAAEVHLTRFLREAQEAGARVVLVITGKGSSDGQEERGVLRRMAPHWLSSPAMRDVVVGFEEAARGHGGTGALYVRIRRPR